MEQNIFEEMAKRYDTEERLALAKVITEEVQKELQHSESKSLIDYGSGTGLVSLALVDLVKSVLLVDSAEQMLEVAQAKITHHKLGNAEVFHADFTKEIPALKADIVLISLVLLHIPETKVILQQLYNILNDDGQLIIVDFDKNEQVNHPKIHNGFVQEDLKDLLSEIGFKSTTTKTFYHGNNIFARQDASMFIAHSVK